MDMQIGNYRLVSPLTTDNSGFSRWGCAVRDGQPYFLKEFLSPVYPVSGEGLSEQQLCSKRKICQDFYRHKQTLYQALSGCQTGNLVTVRDFFRSSSRFYIATEWIDAEPLCCEDVAALPAPVKAVILRSLLYSVDALHRAGIVHADLKPENILLKATVDGYRTAKIIDFDSGFLLHQPAPADAEIGADFVYMAPETYLRIAGSNKPLSEKIDIFALGLILHEYWSGALPSFGGACDYAYQASLNRLSLQMHRSLPAGLAALIASMLCAEPDARPNAGQVFRALPKAVGISIPDHT